MQRWDTSVLAPEVWPELVRAATEALVACGSHEVTTLHGWTTSAFSEHPEFGRYEWAELPSPVAALPALAQARRRLGFTLGRDDWFWSGTATGPFELLWCHEGDLHLKTADGALARALTDAFAAQAVALEPRKLTP